MTAALLATGLALATVALAVAAGAVLIAAADRALRTAWWPRLGARTRASLLAQARLAPLTLVAVLVPVVQLAFWQFEPAGEAESAGVVLWLLAAAGAWCTGDAVVRGVRALRATAVITRHWRRAGSVLGVPGWSGRAWRIDTAFPVVAVVGVRRAELFVSTAVIDACSTTELAAIAAHERAHVASADNLIRAAFALAPVAGPAAARLERAWAATAEEVADLHARATGDGLTLARALTKVARLALHGLDAPALVASAFFGVDQLERRVRRLLEPAQRPGRALRGWPAAAVLPAGLVVALWALPLVYDAAEFLVRLGR